MKNLGKIACLVAGIMAGVLIAGVFQKDAEAVIPKNELKKGYTVGAGPWLITQVRLALAELNSLNPNEKALFNLNKSDDNLKFGLTVMYFDEKAVKKLNSEELRGKLQKSAEELSGKLYEAVNVFSKGVIMNFEPKSDIEITFKAKSKDGFKIIGKYSAGQVTVLQ